MKIILNLGLATASFLGVAVNAQAATFIDTFEEGTIDLEVSPTKLTDSGSVSSKTILGGTRAIDLELTVTNDEAFASTNLFTDSDNFSHSNNTGASSVATVTYDAGNNGLDINLLELGNSFALDITDIDLATQFEIFVVDNNANESSVVSATITQPQIISFDFDSFTGVNLSSIDEIRLVSQGGLNVDVDLDSFSIVGDLPPITPPENFPVSTTTPEPREFMGLLLFLGLSIFTRNKK